MNVCCSILFCTKTVKSIGRRRDHGPSEGNALSLLGIQRLERTTYYRCYARNSLCCTFEHPCGNNTLASLSPSALSVPNEYTELNKAAHTATRLKNGETHTGTANKRVYTSQWLLYNGNTVNKALG